MAMVRIKNKSCQRKRVLALAALEHSNARAESAGSYHF